MGFSKEFVWGAASAAYQVEGGAYADGRGPSIWDIFSHRPGTTANGDTGDVACVSYRLFRDDAAVMTKLGLAAYRFSVSWPRVLPDGTGKVNEQGSAVRLEVNPAHPDTIRLYGRNGFEPLCYTQMLHSL